MNLIIIKYLKSKLQLYYHTCMCILIIAFPINVAPKNVQKGTKKWPQVIPARSNKGLGIWKWVHKKNVQFNTED